jgi:hypothetical protein
LSTAKKAAYSKKGDGSIFQLTVRKKIEPSPFLVSLTFAGGTSNLVSDEA